ncbi:hypothetical protein L9F63_020233 [Diploptera punctata]|uniref:Lipocalin/cytosolic fatty-acid binding domain-containing protein n=1 Tax=Diploptera punctata TaxID=6984 RepID=A0AAD8EDL3_DIPPU|nr:hypothetical protein L9F63_020233 [Diploptera punctata]
MNFEVLMHCLIPKTGIVLAVFKKDDSDKWSDVYKKSILATDYTSYALTLSCKQKFDEKTKEFTRHAVPEIWSRNLTLSQDVMDTLVNVVSGYDIDPSTIQKIDHTNCK